MPDLAACVKAGKSNIVFDTMKVGRMMTMYFKKLDNHQIWNPQFFLINPRISAYLPNKSVTPQSFATSRFMKSDIHSPAGLLRRESACVWCISSWATRISA
jgi:hypothetical protein